MSGGITAGGFDLTSCGPNFDPAAGHFIAVQPDDNFFQIAKRESLPVGDLYQANCQFDPGLQGQGLSTFRGGPGTWDPDFLRPGDQLWIPDSTPTTSSPLQPVTQSLNIVDLPSAATPDPVVPQFDTAPLPPIDYRPIEEPDTTPTPVPIVVPSGPTADPPALKLTPPAAIEPPSAPQAPSSRYDFGIAGTLSLGLISSDNGEDTHTGPILDNRYPSGFKATGSVRLTDDWQARGVAHLWVLDDSSTANPEFNLVWPQVSIGVSGQNVLREGDQLVIEGGQVRGAHDGQTRYGAVPFTPNGGTLVVSNTPTENGSTLAQRFADFNSPFGPGIAASYNLPLSDDGKSFLKLEASHVLYPDPEWKPVEGEAQFADFNAHTTGAAELRLQAPHLIFHSRARVTYDPDSPNDLTSSILAGVGVPINAGDGTTVTPFINGAAVAQGPSGDLGLKANHLLNAAGGVEVSRASVGPDGKPAKDWAANLYLNYVDIERGEDTPRSIQAGGSFTLGDKGPVIRADYTHFDLPGGPDVNEARLTGQLNF